VILSFENHCSVEQQKIVAQYLTNILGGILAFASYQTHTTYTHKRTHIAAIIIIIIIIITTTRGDAIILTVGVQILLRAKRTIKFWGLCPHI